MNSILFFGARSGNGLWKSTNFGASWSKVSSFTNTGKILYQLVFHYFPIVEWRCVGTYAPDPTDTTGYNSDKMGLSFVTFDSTSGKTGSATPRIFVGVANLGSTNVFVSNDAGSTCKSDILVN